MSPHVFGSKHLPPALIALPLAAAAAFALERWAPGFAVETLRTRFQFVVDGVAGSGVPRAAPHLAAPWRLPGPGDRGVEAAIGHAAAPRG